MQADRRMHGAGEAVEEAGLDAAGGEQLAHVFERVDRVLHGLGREAVHQVGMDQDAGLGEGLGDARHLVDRDALLHQLEQAVGGHLQPARDGDAAAVGQLAGTAPGVKDFSKRMLPHQEIARLRRLQLRGQGLERLRRRGLVDEMEAGLPGLGDDGLDAVDQRRRRWPRRSARCSRGETSQKLHFFQ
jgi:hypothetical protein